jgi:hypothetical protein
MTAGRDGGAFLDPVRQETRRLDPAFGVPDVVVHTGQGSTRLAEQQDAAAFTVGRHIVFNAGRYDPGSARGRALIAHELTHVQQQQRGGGDLDAGFRMPAAALPRHVGAAEQQATAAGPVSATGVGIARQSKTAEKVAANTASVSSQKQRRRSRGPPRT